MNADGRNKRQLVPHAAAPSWSPHGAFVSFTRTRTVAFPGDDTREVRTIFTRGLPMVRRWRGESYAGVRGRVEASPDGTRSPTRAYGRTRRAASTSRTRTATTSCSSTSARSWTGRSDGTRILLRSERIAVRRQRRRLPSTQLPEPASHDFAFIESWRWHPDGTRVSFVSGRAAECRRRLRHEPRRTNVTRQTRADCVPRWSISTGSRAERTPSLRDFNAI